MFFMSGLIVGPDHDIASGHPLPWHLQSTPASCRFLSIEPLLEHLGPIPLQGIDWAIVGGESGHGARTMDPEWVESIYAQCRTARIPFFFKQWGGRQKAKTGRMLHGKTYDEMPPVIEQQAPCQEQRRALPADFSRNTSISAQVQLTQRQ